MFPMKTVTLERHLAIVVLGSVWPPSGRHARGCCEDTWWMLQGCITSWSFHRISQASRPHT